MQPKVLDVYVVSDYPNQLMGSVAFVSLGLHPNQLMGSFAFVSLGLRKCKFALNSRTIPCRQILPAVWVLNLIAWTWKHPMTRAMTSYYKM